MRIDDNAWEAGYESGMRDQRQHDAKEIARLQAEIDSLRATLSGRFSEREPMKITVPQFLL